MTSRRRYEWSIQIISPLLADRVVADCQRVLDFEGGLSPQRYVDAEAAIIGDKVHVAVTIVQTDRWRVDWQARRLVQTLSVGARVPVRWFQLVSAERLEPHDHPNRGARWRVRS